MDKYGIQEQIKLLQNAKTAREISETADYFTLIIKENEALKERLSKAIELPCKIGDTVWYVYTKNQREPSEFKVADIQITLQHFKVYVMGTEDGGWLNYTVFLNKEQAEARLKELKEKRE